MILSRKMRATVAYISENMYMYEAGGYSMDDRIDSIHQSHVRPIVRGKSTAKVGSGAKVNVSCLYRRNGMERLQ